MPHEAAQQCKSNDRKFEKSEIENMTVPLFAPPLPNRVGRPALGRIVNAMKSDDIRKSLEIIGIATDPAKRLDTAEKMVALLQDTTASSALKLVGFHIFRASRRFREPTSVGYLSVLKDLSWLRWKLQKAKLERNDYQAAPNVGETEGVATAQHKAPIEDSISDAIVSVYQLGVGRNPVIEEINIWKQNLANGLDFAEFVCLMAASPERDEQKNILPQFSDGLFIQLLYETILGRGCTAKEIVRWQEALTVGRRTRAYVLNNVFSGQVGSLGAGLEVDEPLHDGLSFNVMGTGQFVSIADWKRRSEDIARDASRRHESAIFQSRFQIKRAPMPLVSAITSLYRGGEFIEQFMENITSQSCFRDYCELIIIDAESPENEAAVIERYCRQHKNIVYRRMNYRIGIYEAWNVGAQIARGEYLTNTNLDDLRREDSLALQAGVLENLPFVDVVYQDFLYTFDPRLSPQAVVDFGYQSQLPVINPYNLMDYNSPHNAPMWRKALHQELGYFDTFYKSAGDYEFWMRCMAANKTFYKINDPHVIYYQNPKGLSTRPDTRGIEEAKRILKKYARRLVSENVVMPFDAFAKRLSLQVDAGSKPVSRYMSVQKALRNAAMTSKYRQDNQGSQS